MSIDIYNGNFENFSTVQLREDNLSFNDLVLKYIKINKPDGTLEQLLKEMKQLSPQNTVTMQTLNSALLYSNIILRAEADYVNYTNKILDDRSNQLLGLNMLTNIMLNNISLFNDGDKNDPFL